MLPGLVGKKKGMTRVFTEDGESIPVTVVEIKPSNAITQVKTVETDGYNAIQVTTGEKKASRLTKSLASHFAKAKVTAGDILVEFRLSDNAKMEDFVVGNDLPLTNFKEGQLVDATATSKGKGFAGAVKRWNFSMQRATHGNSLAHRAPGSIGQCQDPGKVFKGKKMAGQMGNKRITIQNLEVVKVDEKRNVLLIKGAIPGAPGNYVVIRPAVKNLNSAVGSAA